MRITKEMIEDWEGVTGPFISKRKWKKRRARFIAATHLATRRLDSTRANRLCQLAVTCFDYFMTPNGIDAASIRVRDYLQAMTIHRERNKRCKPIVRFHRWRFEYRSKSIPSYPSKCRVSSRSLSYSYICSRCLGYPE